MYKVIQQFVDLQDFRRPYNVGDIFPRKGLSVSEERLKELSSNNNRQKKPLIKLVEETKGIALGEPKQTKPTRTEISQMNTENLQKLADSVGIEDAYETSGRKLKELLIEYFNL